MSTRHKDCTLDLILYMRDHKNFTQQVANPLNVKIFRAEQNTVAKNSRDRVLYFDATGAAVRDNKRI